MVHNGDVAPPDLSRGITVPSRLSALGFLPSQDFNSADMRTTLNLMFHFSPGLFDDPEMFVMKWIKGGHAPQTVIWIGAIIAVFAFSTRVFLATEKKSWNKKHEEKEGCCGYAMKGK